MNNTTKINPIPGVRLGTAVAGVKDPNNQKHHDIVVIELAKGGNAAGVFTNNAFCAAPVVLAKQHLATTTPAYLLINSGNANAGNGDQGIKDANICCLRLASITGCNPEQILPFSTGVIGEPLPVVRINAALPTAIANLDEHGWQNAASAIMTTDTVPKFASYTFEVAGHTAVISGIAKGSGMICPNMATMLAYLATDLKVTPSVLQQILQQAVNQSFNAISVDGDTSTNDACMLLASGKHPSALIDDPNSSTGMALTTAVNAVCTDLATAIVRDGEGATKLVHIVVDAAINNTEARQVAYTIAHSPLVKTALFAADPNWGRILAAIGRAGLVNLNINFVQLYLDNLCIVHNGCRATNYTDEAGRAILQQAEFTILVNLGRGNSSAAILTCDLSYDYVRINAEYRS
ncbi:ornithine acetyltransferase [Achromatium sp. WMS1]|nr:ornithine acetyltransferase [Achromatium sp. WMS1]